MADEGASPKEQVLEAARRNNTDLLQDVLSQITKQAQAQRTKKPEDVIAQVLNSARDGIGMGVLHLAALNGNCEQYPSFILVMESFMADAGGADEVLDLLLDQEGLEIDEIDRMDRDTPLHKAVRHINSLDQKEWEAGQEIVDILVDAGCDPRIRNGAKLRPVDLADPRNQALRKLLQQAEFSIQAGDDVVEEDDGAPGSGSESD